MRTGNKKNAKTPDTPPNNSELPARAKLFIRSVREEEFPVAVVQMPVAEFPMPHRYRGWGINE